MKVVIVSDIHGNLEALTSIPEDFDELWVLGDLVNYGPDPAAVVDVVRARASVIVRGNHDHAVGFDEDPHCAEPFREMALAMKAYTISVLSDEQRQFLRDLPLISRRTMAGFTVTCCHAVPSEPLFAYCPQDHQCWEAEVKEAGTDVLLVGHTHLPFIREWGTAKVINPGSLGQPKIGFPHACYAVWDQNGFELREFEYPFEETIRKVQALPVSTDVQADLSAVLRNGGLSQPNPNNPERL